ARLRRSGAVVVEQELGAQGFRHVRVALLADPAAAGSGKAQAALLTRLQEAGGRMRVPDLVRDHASGRGALERLAAAGAVRIATERETRQPEVLEGNAASPLVPSADQARVLEPLLQAVAGSGFAPFLLHGVTGSGKTEVYFRAAERALEAGRGV